MEEGSRDRVALGLSAAVITVTVIVWAVQGDQTTRVASFLAWFGVAFVALFMSVRRASHSLRRFGSLSFEMNPATLSRVTLVLSSAMDF